MSPKWDGGRAATVFDSSARLASPPTQSTTPTSSTDTAINPYRSPTPSLPPSNGTPLGTEFDAVGWLTDIFVG